MADSDMRWARLDPTYAPPNIDTTVPSVARVYDAILGGKDNFAVDRVVAEEAMRTMSDGGNGARLNRAALGRAVRYMAERGVSQFLDLGSGLPTAQNTHQIAQRFNPKARVVYVDNDPSVSVHGQALLTGDDSTVVVLADVRSPDELLALPAVAGFLDFRQPVGLILNAVVHHLNDDENPHGIVARYREAIAPGSYLQLTHFCDESAEARANSEVLTRSLGRGQVRSRAEIVSFFDGLDLVPPGVVFLPWWRPDGPVASPPPAGSMLMLVGVGKKTVLPPLAAGRS
jgi:S-adenosyl methyltransferase